MAKWFMASVHSLAEPLPSAVMFFSASQMNVIAAASLRKSPRVLTILRSRKTYPREITKSQKMAQSGFPNNILG